MAVSLKYAKLFLVSVALLALLLLMGGASWAQELAVEKVNSTTPPAGEEKPDPIPHVEEPEDGASSEQTYGNIDPTFVADSRSIANTAAESPVFSVYKDFDAWWNDDRDGATLRAMGKTLGTDWFTPKVADCKDGISTETDVAVFTSNSYGYSSTRNAQNSPECQTSLEEHLKRGKVLIVDMGDNDYGGGFKAPGAQGIATDRYPSNSSDATLAPAAKGPDRILRKFLADLALIPDCSREPASSTRSMTPWTWLTPLSN